MIDLNVKCRAIKLLGDDIRENLEDQGPGDFFLDTIGTIHERNN